MTDRNEDRVRERAYAIWEKEGRPDGEDLRHWSAAEAELRGETTNEQARKQIEETEAATRATGVPVPPPSLASPD
ncbi:hypothetical protein FHX08_000510 [Rhizobium sp. BK529]|uniref:DUF2934 domain-containing protein n=1 Tax=unclassified Rhizobium TaxID=2613769 RepID=UPI001042E13E|nr:MULTISPECIES: DUF2934 domain-containing protein [unclassified Rhizobium]MBB3590166.1 hypothetical protein [Rhizobium sp. BK529]TCS04861.1 DUF2934 family protein [Rhizobium sp. BK418]